MSVRADEAEREGAVVTFASWEVCGNCFAEFEDHLALQCLFAPTRFSPARAWDSARKDAPWQSDTIHFTWGVV